MSTDPWSTYREALAALNALPDRRRQSASVANDKLAKRLAEGRERAKQCERDVEGVLLRLRERREQLDALTERLGASPAAGGLVQPMWTELSLVAAQNELEQLAAWADATVGTLASLERTLTRESIRTPIPVNQALPALRATPEAVPRRRVFPLILVVALVGVIVLIIILILRAT